jgi:hypothetical protein
MSAILPLIGLGGACVVALVARARSRARNTPPPAVDLLRSKEAFVQADQYFAQAQKAEAAHDVQNALTMLFLATRQMSLGAQYGLYGEERAPELPADIKDDIPRMSEAMRPHYRKLGLNDGFLADVAMMIYAHSEGDKIDRQRLISFCYAGRTENTRVATYYCGRA